MEHRVAFESKPPERVRFGAFELDRGSGELRRDGTSLKLQPQPAKVLALLVSRAGEVVTRQELAGQVWGSETFVDFEQGLNYAIRQIRTALEDDADHPRFLETLPKRGYRFIAPVEDAYQPETVASGKTPAGTERLHPGGGNTTGRRSWQWAALCVACLAALIGMAVRYRETRLPTATTASIQSVAVLPLANLSADPAQEYFSDGLTDELITELAKTSNLRVISRTSIMGFKGSRKRAPEIGQELHVDAIVEGTVERSGNQVRIRAQLIRADSDQHIWAESYDRDVNDLLGLERDVARDIAQKIGRRVFEDIYNVNRVAPLAHEDYLRGRYYWNKRTESGLRKGIEYFRKRLNGNRTSLWPTPGWQTLTLCWPTGDSILPRSPISRQRPLPSRPSNSTISWPRPRPRSLTSPSFMTGTGRGLKKGFVRP